MKVIKFTHKPSDPLVGFFDLEIPEWGIQIRSMSLFKKGSSHYWLRMPGIKVEKDGEEPFTYHFVRFTDMENSKRFMDEAKQAILQHLKDLQIPV